jgi:hypothetical protein
MSRSASSLACRALLLPSPSSSSSPLLRRSMAKAAASATDAPPDEAAAAAKTQPKRSLIRAKTPSLYDDFEYDETTNIGHEMVQKEREALAFMRTVELELPKLKRTSHDLHPLLKHGEIRESRRGAKERKVLIRLEISLDAYM